MSESLVGYAPDQQVVTTVGDIMEFAAVAWDDGRYVGTAHGVNKDFLNPFRVQHTLEDEASDQAAGNDRSLFPYAEGLEQHADDEAENNDRDAFPYAKEV